MSAEPNNPQARIQQALQSMKSVWVRLVDPRQIDQPPFYMARWLSTVALIMTVALLAVMTWDWLTPDARVLVALLALAMFVGFTFNRHGYYKLASAITAAALIVLGFSALLQEPFSNFYGITISLLWVAPMLFVCFLILPLRGLLVALAVVIGIVLLVPAIYTEVAYADIVVGLFYLLLVGAVLLIGALRNTLVLQQIQLRQDEVEQERTRYRELLDATFEALIVTRDGVILDMNRAAEEMFGYSRDEAINRDGLRFVEPAFHEVARLRREQLQPDPYELRCMRKDGTHFWVEVRGKPHHYDGQVVRVAAIRDITQRKLAEAQQMDFSVEREKVLVLQRFIGDMSHDLRTPLSVIKTCAYLIDKLVTSNQPDKLQRQVEVLHTQIDHLQRMLDDLLHMSRLDKADTSSYEFIWHDLHPLIADVVDELRSAALRKNLRLEWQAPASTTRALVDENEFKRMVKHLLRNAINYTPDGGMVSVITRRADKTISVEISDTGAGINPLELPYIFERFYRGDQARSANSGGTGLGLTIAKKIVEAHNGTIEAESEIGKGSTFRITLPARDA
jgi:two-component system phosphate regulon sensor histidine kinase PhoR